MVESFGDRGGAQGSYGRRGQGGSSKSMLGPQSTVQGWGLPQLLPNLAAPRVGRPPPCAVRRRAIGEARRPRKDDGLRRTVQEPWTDRQRSLVSATAWVLACVWLVGTPPRGVDKVFACRWPLTQRTPERRSRRPTHRSSRVRFGRSARPTRNRHPWNTEGCTNQSSRCRRCRLGRGCSKSNCRPRTRSLGGRNPDRCPPRRGTSPAPK